MKKTSLYLASLALAACGFAACDNEFERPPMVVPTSDWTANTTIEEFKSMYWNTVEGTPTTVGLNADGDSIVVKGRVCSSDETGNIFKYLFIQGEKEALALSLDFYDIYKTYKFGQEVYVNLTGLTIGGYSGLMCVGYGTDDRGRVARAPEALFGLHAEVNGLPNAEYVDTTVVSIAELDAAKASAEGLEEWQSRLVRFDNVRFEDAGQPFAVGTSSVSRYIVDADGNRMNVYNSTYADFKDELLPVGNGSVVGILSYFGTNWQVLLIDRQGCFGFEGIYSPVFSPAGGVVKPETAVTITCATEGAAIYYTLDGTEPTEESTLYTEPIVLTEDVTIRAIAITEDGKSNVATASFIVSDEVPEEGDGTAEKPYTASQAKAKAIENGSASTENVYVKGYIVSGSINMQYGTGTWTIADNPQGTGDTFELYGTYNTDNKKFTDENAVKVGDLVVAVGPIFNYNSKTPEMSKGHLVSINGEGGSTVTPDPTPDTPEGDGTADKPYNATQAKAKAIENGSSSTDNVYVKGYIVSGSINMQYGTGTWTIANNAQGTGDTFTLYGTYNTDNKKFTDENAVKVGDLVVAVGPIFNYNSQTPEMSKGHLVSINDNGGSTVTPDPTPAGNVIFSESFQNGNLGDFTTTVETSGTWSGWKPNTNSNSPACAIANSYVNNVNETATAWLISPPIDLKDCKSVTMTLEQGLGFYFPTSQSEFCTVNVRVIGGDWQPLTLTNFPTKGTGNWSATFAENTFDLSAYAGQTVEIGFKYYNDGKQSVAWEINNFKVTAEK